MTAGAQQGRRLALMVTSSISLAFFAGQVRRMRARGWEVGVISSPTVPGQLEGFTEAEGAVPFPISMEREISPVSDVRSLRRLYGTLRGFRPTLLNVNTPKAGLLGGIAGVAARVPVRVYTLHGLRLETATGLKRVVLTAAERIAMGCAHRIVCVSPSLRDRVHELGLAPRHKTLVLGSGSVRGVDIPDTQALAPRTAALRTELGLPVETPVVGFVGRLVRDKGIAELIQAYASIQPDFPDMRLLLIGGEEEGDPVPGDVWRTLERLPGVIRTGAVPDVKPYYPLMSVLALPTYREGFPTVALEAAAAGLPLVTTTATGARDAVRHGETGWLVPVGDAEALATALRQAIERPDMARRYGEEARAWVSREFDPAQVQELWLEFYEMLLTWHALSRQHLWKRRFDVVVSTLALFALGLPMLALALLVRSRLGSPVLFSQVRPGLHGQPFTMYKFRTMTDERGPDGELLPDARRLTPFGAWMRSTSLDELPELLNVLRGDMSLVGPRPLLMEYLPLYTAEQAQRHEVRPGITGWAQINGRNALSWEEKFEHDVWYVENRTLALDLRILWMTVLKVLRRDGISAQGEATMPKFMGTSSYD